MTGDAKNQPGRNKLFVGYRGGKISLGRFNKPLGRVSLGLLMRGVKWSIWLIVTSRFSYSNSNLALCTTATWFLLCSPTNQQLLKKRVLSDSKAFKSNLDTAGPRAGKLWKNFMPRQHVGSLKSHHAIPLFKVKNMECDLAVQLHIPRT